MKKPEPGTGSLFTATRLAFTAALGGFLFGYDSAVINGAVRAISDHFHAPSALGFSGVRAARRGDRRVIRRPGRRPVRAAQGDVDGGDPVPDQRSGRRLVGTLPLLIVFRIIGGIGVGVASVIAPAYIAEIAPARIRGRLGSLQQLAIVLGIFLALLVDYVLAQAAGGSGEDLWLGLEAWRWMFLSMAVPALVYGGLALTIPESPRYLVPRSRLDEAARGAAQGARQHRRRRQDRARSSTRCSARAARAGATCAARRLACCRSSGSGSACRSSSSSSGST